MKRILPYVILVVVVGVLLFYAKKTEEFTVMISGNYTGKPLEMEFGKFLCSDCTMMIKKYKFSAQVILPNEETYFFDDIGCMIRWLDKQEDKEKIKVFVYTLDTRTYIDPKDALFSRIETTPIGYGFGAYDANQTKKRAYYFDILVGAESYEIRPYAKEKLSYEQVKLLVLRGETLLNPIIKKEVLGDKLDADFWSKD